MVSVFLVAMYVVARLIMWDFNRQEKKRRWYGEKKI